MCVPPQPEADDIVVPRDVWTVRGQVTDSAGNAVARATVRLRDAQEKFAGRLAPTKTDDQGRFTLTYREQEVEDLVKADPDLFLEVSDEAGKTLYSSTEGLKFRGGQVQDRDVGTTTRPTRPTVRREDLQGKDPKSPQAPKDRP